MIDWTILEPRTEDLRRTFADARPFPHVVIDNAISGAELLQAWRDWPDDSAPWQPSQRNKRSLRQDIPPTLANVIRALNGNRFVAWLAAITGIPDLTADYELSGAGLHETGSGGCLPLHVDFNRLGDLYRRLNVLLFMNRGWDDFWMGSLELADNPKKPKHRIVISPQFNRMVIAESSDRSWHGHPHVLRCPIDVVRRSIATYYYSRTPHESYTYQHSTKYIVDKERSRSEQRQYEREFVE